MKYLVAATGPDLESSVARRFGHAPYFLVVDAQTMKIEKAHPNDHDAPGHGLAGFKDTGVERVIVGNIGPEAFADVVGMGWRPYLGRSLSVRDAVAKAEAGDLPALHEPTVKKSLHQGEGHQHHRESHHEDRK